MGRLVSRSLPARAGLLLGLMTMPAVADVSSRSPLLPDGRQRAFPSAEGFGAGARGGRGGRAIFVDNLAEDGPGSLRACIEAAGPRTCIFKVSGTITLEKRPLDVTQPYLTIAGETAPGDGIAIRNGPRQEWPSLQIKSHDVIVRHIRLRPGPHAVPSCCSGALGLYTDAARDIILDHISASWGSDETIDSENARDFTIQWSIVSEPLVNGGPGKRNRARNMLLTKGGNISVHHNLFALGRFRSPQIAPADRDSVVEIVNNVLYSPVWDSVIALDDRWAPIQADVIGNYKIAGRNNMNDRLVHLFQDGRNPFSIYLSGNHDESYRLGDTPQREALLPELQAYAAQAPHRGAGAPGIAAGEAKAAYRAVLAGAGATRPKRDAVDRRIVATVERRDGKFLKKRPEKRGGWPDLRSATPPEDGDRDGIADRWERAHGLDPNDGADATQDRNGDGWTNREEYLHELAGDRATPDGR